MLLSAVGPAIKEIAKQAAAAAESGKSAKKGKGKEKDAAVSKVPTPRFVYSDLVLFVQHGTCCVWILIVLALV